MANADICNNTTTFNQPNNTPTQWDNTSITELWALRGRIECAVFAADEKALAEHSKANDQEHDRLAGELVALEDYLIKRTPENKNEALCLISLVKNMLCFTGNAHTVYSKINDILGQVNFTAEIA